MHTQNEQKTTGLVFSTVCTGALL